MQGVGADRGTRRYPGPMPPTRSCAPVRPRVAAVVDDEIRELSAGRNTAEDWDPDALARLAVLRAEWLAAVAEERGAA